MGVTYKITLYVNAVRFLTYRKVRHEDLHQNVEHLEFDDSNGKRVIYKGTFLIEQE